jgi:hypothetical protein
MEQHFIGNQAALIAACSLRIKGTIVLKSSFQLLSLRTSVDFIAHYSDFSDNKVTDM